MNKGDNMSAVDRALIYSDVEPTEAQEKRFEKVLLQKYGREFEILWIRNEDIKSGFCLVVGDDVYDWTAEGRISQLKEMLSGVVSDTGSEKIKTLSRENLIDLFRTSMDSWNVNAEAQEEGIVTMLGDGIAFATGLDHAVYGEIVVFESGVKGMIQDLRPDRVGIILFDDEESIMEGSRVKRTGKAAGIPVGEDFLGRVIDPLGAPIDNRGIIRPSSYHAIESPAPEIIDREPVEVPMDTGILCIDSMFPIGRGQRELIIGDRQTGKTTIATDTILNQKGKNVVCIYVAIGQKASSIAQLVESLRKNGAMDYTIVVNSSASDSAPLQYIAPYAGTAMGEYFMQHGRDVLIVYDDLSKHAIAYRALSLLLERSPGREAYPGDVFYLHSRLLERSARLTKEKGGGSMTALPIVETQAGDVSAYIPTNIISITDGQIFLESDLFFAGQRPAVNVGLSVSRVGGAAQTKAMKKATGSIRLDLAQFREMEVFTQFSNDLDDSTKKRLAYGQGLMYLLRQNQGHPFRLHEQVIILIAGTAHVMQDIPLRRILDFRDGLLAYFAATEPALCENIDKTGKLNDEEKQQIIKRARSFLEEVTANGTYK
ncbi:MAG: F0F1 ATP synthase subunit alpha [Eubacterium sp.]|nr:F0F1 ATP synthase subunit alpha [Eubacterium sp.]